MGMKWLGLMLIGGVVLCAYALGKEIERQRIKERFGATLLHTPEPPEYLWKWTQDHER